MARGSSSRGALDHLSCEPGEVLTFPTEPYSHRSPSPTHRHAAIKILSVDRIQKTVIASVLDCISETQPRLADLQDAGIMHASPLFGRPIREMIFNLTAPEGDAPAFVSLGVLEVSDDEAKKMTSMYVPVDRLSANVEAAWRSAHDHENFDAEVSRLRAEAELRASEVDTYRRDRLLRLTIPGLMSETPLTAWDARAEFIPAQFSAAVRKCASAMLREILSAAASPNMDAVRLAMRSFVDQVRDETGRYPDASPIETLEREELFEFLEEVAWAAGQPGLAREIEDWCDW